MHVKKVLMDRPQGTFLWIGIVAGELRKYKATETESALNLFPPGLNNLYARMLVQIDVNRRETAAKTLHLNLDKPMNIAKDLTFGVIESYTRKG